MFRSPLRSIVLVAALAVAGVAAGGASAAGTPPSNTSPPTISGHPVQGHLLVASPGVWSGTPPITFAYQWLRCDQIGAGCSAIVTAKTQSYLLTAADVGHTLRVAVTASNAYGTSTATSKQTPVIATAVPVNTAPPTISGTAQDGETLTASSGSWSGARPLTFVFTWHRCDASGAGCVHVAGANGQTYVVSSADVGHTLRVGVTATNQFGKGVARSAATAVVVAAQRTVTLASARRSVVYGGRVQLVGKVSPGHAGIAVTIQALRYGTAARRRVATVSTAADGSFSATVKPGILTAYRAQLANGTTSPSVAVGVRPHLRLKSVGRHVFDLTVDAARSFVGRLALVQVWRPSRHAWRTIGRLHLSGAHVGTTTRTTRVFVLRIAHGLKVRVRLPLNQTATGYLPGTSNTIRA